MFNLNTVDAITDNTGANFFVNENGDPTGVLDYTDNGDSQAGTQAYVDSQPAPTVVAPTATPATPTAAPAQGGGGFDWGGLLKTALSTGATALVSPNGTPAGVAAAKAATAQAQVNQQKQTNTWLIILVVIVVVGILLYFVFKKSK